MFNNVKLMFMNMLTDFLFINISMLNVDMFFLPVADVFYNVLNGFFYLGVTLHKLLNMVD